MAASAATLRLLLRRRASAPAPPSMARLQPLFPGRYSTPCSPFLPAAAAASAELHFVRRAQVSPAAVPYPLRHYSSKPSKGSAPQLPADGKGTPRQNQVKQHCSIVTYSKRWLHLQLFLNAQKNLLKRGETMNEALEMFEKAINSLPDEEWDDKAIAMFGNELDNTWSAFAAYEKAVDDFAKAVGSNNGLPVHILEQYQTLCKKLKDRNERSRQYLEKISSKFENLKKLNKAEFSSPSEILKMLTVTAVGLGTCLVLTVVIATAYLDAQLI